MVEAMERKRPELSRSIRAALRESEKIAAGRQGRFPAASPVACPGKLCFTEPETGHGGSVLVAGMFINPDR